MKDAPHIYFFGSVGEERQGVFRGHSRRKGWEVVVRGGLRKLFPSPQLRSCVEGKKDGGGVRKRGGK